MPSGTGQRAWRASDRDWAFWIDIIAIRRSSTDAYTAGLPPYPGQAVLLANASLVLKPYLDSRTGRLHRPDSL
jgi:hypothetical protein